MNSKTQIVLAVMTVAICVAVYMFKLPAPVPDQEPEQVTTKAKPTSAQMAAATKTVSQSNPAASAPKPSVSAAAPAIVSTAEDSTVTTASGLKYKIVQEGTGAVAKAGQTVSVHYTGTLTDGTKFDSSRDRGEPIQFILGTGRVIKGWDEGVAGMKVGEKRKLIIPADLGYGANGAGGGVIPPNAILLFDVELVDAK